MKKTNNIYQIMEIMVIEAIKIIQKEAAHFSRKNKTHYSGSNDDLVTSADIKAQAMYLRQITKYFPNDGIIGEENGLNKIPKKGYGYFTIDPLDGTKAFGRKQSTGCATMIAHVNQHEEVDAICIGDINTGEIYGFGPNQKPKRIRFNVTSSLICNTGEQLQNKYLLLKDKPSLFPREIQKVIDIFKDIDIASGSIGLLVARLWKNEVGAMICRPQRYDTPWDNTPLIGMNKALGIINILYNTVTKEIEIINTRPPKIVEQKDGIEFLVHKDYKDQLIDMIKSAH